MIKDSTTQRMEIIRDTIRLEKRIFGAALQFKNLMGQRKGQALMNALRHEAPELYEIISGTPQDCFYNDAKYLETLDILGFHQFGSVLDEEPAPVKIINPSNPKQEWCPFCKWIPKGGMHIWGNHTMDNYQEKPDVKR